MPETHREDTAAWSSLVARLTDDDATAMLCGVGRSEGRRCPRRADYLVDFHGCAIGLICELHLDEWTRATAAAFDGDGGVPCRRCGAVFATVADTYTLVPAL